MRPPGRLERLALQTVTGTPGRVAAFFGELAAAARRSRRGELRHPEEGRGISSGSDRA